MSFGSEIRIPSKLEDADMSPKLKQARPKSKLDCYSLTETVVKGPLLKKNTNGEYFKFKGNAQ